MAKDPAFLFYTGDFSTGTQFFSNEQVGIYLRLLMAQHQHGRLTEKQVIIISKTLDNEVMRKFTIDTEGLYYNERLESEVEKRKAFSDSRRNNKLGKTKEVKNKSKSYVNHMEDENKNKDIIKKEKKERDEFLISQFEIFWNLYPKKVEKKKAQAIFLSLTIEEIKKIIQTVPNFARFKPFPTYSHPNPTTYLNGKRWEDELKQENNTHQPIITTHEFNEE